MTRVRAQDANGDYTLGNGSANFLVNSPEMVGQLIETNLLLFEGEWFLDLTIGLPLTQEILGYSNAALRDMLIKSQIINTPGVTSIETYNSDVNTATRSFTVQGTVLTQYSTQPVAFGPITL